MPRFREFAIFEPAPTQIFWKAPRIFLHKNLEKQKKMG
jgi:hypothetical protein